MINVQFPGRLVAGDKTAFGGAYPLKDLGTGLNNTDWNNYPAAINDRIFPVAHPLDPKRLACVSYEVHPGDKQPHYPGSSGERAELQPEPHDGVPGLKDAICTSWVIPAPWQSPTGWCIILQNHSGPGSASLSPAVIISLTSGMISAGWEYHRLADIVTDREFFVALDSFWSYNADGYVKYWFSWDKPPDVTKPPAYTKTGATQQGNPMSWKTGLYRNITPGFSNKVIQTTLARRPTLAEAVVVAGWPAISGGTPLPSPALLRDEAVAALEETTVSYPQWKARLDAGKYPDPSKTKWQQAFDSLGKIR